MILSTWCEVWVIVGQVEHPSSATDAGGIWLHLVILVFVCLPKRLRMLRGSGRHNFELEGGDFCVLKGLHPGI